jgi:hypothetical protein
VTALTLADRCDFCPAAALTWWENGKKQELMFCGHHSDKFAAELGGQGWNLAVDDREGQPA